MDGMNGIETARELRERQEDTVLIFITGYGEFVKAYMWFLQNGGVSSV